MKRTQSGEQCARHRIIKQRGDWCENCLYPGYIELHHILEVSNGDKNNDENLILLCEKCHAETHGYNKKNYLDKARLMWEEIV